ncbi:hypothetical protein PIB30_075669 [Stylosanthes scabra]|uniref:Uncharacterized protein n=1 Tax=Stylosanthes scabra TaxID=79078 RepID=A0ABU6VR77_9FABA|nr:hypothetical protein [Stylosanthes scabra]
MEDEVKSVSVAEEIIPEVEDNYLKFLNVVDPLIEMIGSSKLGCVNEINNHGNQGGALIDGMSHNNIWDGKFMLADDDKWVKENGRAGSENVILCFFRPKTDALMWTRPKERCKIMKLGLQWLGILTLRHLTPSHLDLGLDRSKSYAPRCYVLPNEIEGCEGNRESAETTEEEDEDQQEADNEARKTKEIYKRGRIIFNGDDDDAILTTFILKQSEEKS